MVVVLDEAVNRLLERDQRGERAALQAAPGQLAKKPSIAFSHEHEVGVKWNTQRGWRTSHLRTFGCLWAA